MCFGGSAPVNSGPQMTLATANDPNGGGSRSVYVEAGIPQDYIDKGAGTVAQWQQMASQDLSDKQIASQREIAQQQQDFAQKQADAQQRLLDEEKQQTQAQTQRQIDYDAGRSKQYAEGVTAVNNAFGRFTDNNQVFDQYAKDYMAKATDDINYQKTQAQKDLAFQLSRQGLQSSQAGVNQQGLLEETSGRATALQTGAAQDAADTFKRGVISSKQNVLDQLQTAQSIGGPIAGSTSDSVNQAINNQRSAISGLTSTAGDVVSSFNAVPTVNPLSNIFAGILGAGGSAIQGLQAGGIMGKFNAGANGTNPSGSGSTTLRAT